MTTRSHALGWLPAGEPTKSIEVAWATGPGGWTDNPTQREGHGVNGAVQSTEGEPRALDGDAELEALVLRARAGERRAFGMLVEVLQKPLFFAVVRITNHPQDARDVVQRAFLKAWEKLGSLDDPQRFRSWLFTIALNLARNLRRDQGRHRHEPVEENTLVTRAGTVERMSQRQRRDLLRQALEALPPRQREVVTMRIDAELSFKDIGEAVGCTEATARVNFHHGMKRLRELLASEEG